MRLTILTCCALLLLGVGLAPAAAETISRGATSQRTSHDKYSFELKQLGGGDEKLSKVELTADLPLVLVVWAPDCPYCLRDMPYILSAYKKLDKEKANFMTIAFSEDKDEIQELIDDKDLTFPVLWNKTGSYGDGFENDGYPTTYVFRQGGKLQEMVESDGPAYVADVLAAVDAARKQ